MVNIENVNVFVLGENNYEVNGLDDADSRIAEVMNDVFSGALSICEKGVKSSPTRDSCEASRG